MKYLKEFAAILFLFSSFGLLLIISSNKQNTYEQNEEKPLKHSHEEDSSSSDEYNAFLHRLQGPLGVDDNYLTSYLKEFHLYPPSTKDYNLTTTDFYTKYCYGLSWPFIHDFVQKAFGDKKDGFFVEAGALDGQCLSNSLWLEQNRGWTGLLVEADPNNFADMVYKNRKAWLSDTCLSSDNYPEKISFISTKWKKENTIESIYARAWSHDVQFTLDHLKVLESVADKKLYKIQCFPLYTYLKVLNVTVIDFLSLDIQGPDLEVFKTLPLDKILVRAVVIEDESKGYQRDLVETMNSKGFEFVLLGGAPDYIFINKKEKELLNKFNYTILQNYFKQGAEIFFV